MPYSAGPMSNTNSYPAALSQALIGAGQLFHARGWVPATGGNFSARLGGDRMLITASGCHKGELAEADFLVADLDGKPIDPKLNFVLNPGQELVLETPGGGGFGEAA